MSDASGIRAPAASTARAPIAGRADSPVGVFPTLSLPTRDELTKAWGDGVLRSLSGKAKAYLQSGRFVGVDPDGAVFALPNEQWVSRSQDVRAEAETALAARFGGPVPLKLVVETAAGAPVAPATRAPEEPFDPAEFDHLQDAEVEVVSPEQRLLEAFPGAEEVST